MRTEDLKDAEEEEEDLNLEELATILKLLGNGEVDTQAEETPEVGLGRRNRYTTRAAPVIPFRWRRMELDLELVDVLVGHDDEQLEQGGGQQRMPTPDQRHGFSFIHRAGLSRVFDG